MPAPALWLIFVLPLSAAQTPSIEEARAQLIVIERRMNAAKSRMEPLTAEIDALRARYPDAGDPRSCDAERQALFAKIALPDAALHAVEQDFDALHRRLKTLVLSGFVVGMADNKRPANIPAASEAIMAFEHFKQRLAGIRGAAADSLRAERAAYAAALAARQRRRRMLGLSGLLAAAVAAAGGFTWRKLRRAAL